MTTEDMTTEDARWPEGAEVVAVFDGERVVVRWPRGQAPRCERPLAKLARRLLSVAPLAPLYRAQEVVDAGLYNEEGLYRATIEKGRLILSPQPQEKTDMIRPLGNNVVLRRDNPEKTTPGGLVIPETAADKEKVYTGVVIAVGRGKVTDSGRLIEPECRAGDRVVFEKYSQGHEIEHDGEKLVIIRGENVVGVLQ